MNTRSAQNVARKPQEDDEHLLKVLLDRPEERLRRLASFRERLLGILVEGTRPYGP